MSEPQQGQVPIASESDIVKARNTVRGAAQSLRFGVTDVTRIVTAASELTRNIYRYAGAGVMEWRYLSSGDQQGLELTFIDHGPGIADIEQAMQPGVSSSGGLGLGLPGAKRLMDELTITSTVGNGTTVTVRKWRRKN
jgi:serine/threonine-protein kinase RsbT